MFISPKKVDLKTFKRCSKTLSKQSPIQLHFTNEACLKKYNKDIVEFLLYLIRVGEYYEEYEVCDKLNSQKKKYKNWLKINTETIKSISELLNSLAKKI